MNADACLMTFTNMLVATQTSRELHKCFLCLILFDYLWFSTDVFIPIVYTRWPKK